MFYLLTSFSFLILGDSLNASLVAVITVDPDVLKEWASSVGIKVVLLTPTISLFLV